jgi:hypothetical protein
VSDDNVVSLNQFRKPEPQEPRELTIWACGDCDCITFKIRSDGFFECANCERLSNDSGLWRLPAAVPSVDTLQRVDQTGVTEIVDFPAAANLSARERIIQRVRSEETIAVAVIGRSDRVSTWLNEPDRLTERHFAWIRRRFRRAKQMIGHARK